MKIFGVLAAVLFVTVVVADFKCPTYANGVQCFENPCATSTNTCRAGQICCANYSKGCNVNCYRCPKTSGRNCLMNPCQNNPCTAGTSCCPDYSTCTAKCY